MAVRVSIGGMRQDWGWRPMPWIVAGLDESGGFNDNADGFGFMVQRGAGPCCWSGWREVGGDTRSKENGQEIWGENGSDGGWPVPSNKKKKTEKGGELWLEPLFDGAYAAFHGVFNGSSETVALQKPISQH
ncbi:unnamed protein product [Tetraodon nigroviridis]|uniref:(spotted green pufferfish) hypothetical protein n=1 Tax=Tetraodon nigroviridis TaxID=99883 RepID=Q4RLZ3_TETNG|nr:unnamed protein product [Tetraodon nigroviridis]